MREMRALLALEGEQGAKALEIEMVKDRWQIHSSGMHG